MKTTKSDFDKFKQYCSEALQTFQLIEWSVHYDHANVEGSYANTSWRLSGGVATITLSTYWDDLRPKTDDAIKRLAYHEVLHLVMAPLYAEAGERYTNQLAIDTAEHMIIRRLENLIVTGAIAQ